MKHITSMHNESLKQLARWVQHKRDRDADGVMVLEGVHLIQTFLRAEFDVEKVFVPIGRTTHPEVAEILSTLPQEYVVTVEDGILSKVTSLAQSDDMMAVVRQPESIALPTSGDCVVLECIQDPGNVGTILRSAVAAGVRQVILSDDCADVWSPKVLRSGMGAHAFVSIFQGVDLVEWCQYYHNQIYATTLTPHAVSLYELDLHGDAAWLFGNEGGGLSKALHEQADQSVVIPMVGQMESLNVAMAASVCLFEQHRQRLVWAGS